jgi:hypothetical protein
MQTETEEKPVILFSVEPALSLRSERVGANCVAAALCDMNTWLYLFSDICEKSLKLGQGNSTIKGLVYCFYDSGRN